MTLKQKTQIIELTEKSFTCKEIGELMGKNVRTISSHKKMLYTKKICTECGNEFYPLKYYIACSDECYPKALKREKELKKNIKSKLRIKNIENATMKIKTHFEKAK